jgi:hypothetical protein
MGGGTAPAVVKLIDPVSANPHDQREISWQW